MKRRIKTILAPIIVATTAVVFGYYIKHHPETIDQIKLLPPITVAVLLVLYALSFLAYALITRISLSIYQKTISKQEGLLFNAYSSLINFFGPGQSGPVFRAAYLKKRHDMSIKQFTFTLFLYLGFYAVINAMFMIVGSRPWWQTVALMLLVATASYIFVRRYKKTSHIETGNGLNPVNLGWLLGATIVQVVVLAVIYGIELHRVGADVSISQVLSYTGVSNFSLFVALTPGAIGIREAFLVFSQNLHHIDSTTIVAANIVDRAVYLLFLGLLFILVIALHARDKLNISQLKTKKG